MTIANTIADPMERRTWREFCSVVQSPLGQFQDIQNTLLSEQLGQLATGKWTSVFPTSRPKSIGEFRRIAPIHQWRDYLDILQPETYDARASEVQCWVQTSWSHGSWKRVPWTRRFFDAQCRHAIAALMMSVARNEGDVRLSRDFRVLPLLPGTPFASAWLGQGVTKRGIVKSYLDPEEDTSHNAMPQRIQAGLQRSMRTGVDCVVGMSSTLFMARNLFRRMTAHTSFSGFASRFGIQSALRRQVHKLTRSTDARSLEPKSLLSPKSVITWGADTSFLTPALEAQWGAPVFQLYASSEAGILAMQDWRRKGLIFLPTSVYLEFLPEGAPPESEALLLLNQLEVGKHYEPVITSFYGMPFLRLRQGDLLSVTRRNEHGIPEFDFLTRADDVIDLGSIARIDRPTLAEALASVGIGEGQWQAKKEYRNGRPVLCIYLSGDAEQASELQSRIHRALGKVDPHYREASLTLSYPLLHVLPLQPPFPTNGRASPEAVKAAL